MKKQFKVPFDKNRNQVTFYYSRIAGYDLETDEPQVEIESGITLKDNYIFESTLSYHGFERGRSSLNIVWKDRQGKLFRSGMAMLDEILRSYPNNVTSYLGESLIIWGTFTFKKQGTAVLLTFKK